MQLFRFVSLILFFAIHFTSAQDFLGLGSYGNTNSGGCAQLSERDEFAMRWTSRLNMSFPNSEYSWMVSELAKPIDAWHEFDLKMVDNCLRPVTFGPIWNWNATSTLRIGLPGWVGQWKRYPNLGQTLDHELAPLTANVTASFGVSIPIAGYSVNQVTITPNGQIYLGSTTPQGGARLLPFGDKLVSGSGNLRFSWVKVDNRNTGLEQVFVIELSDFELMGLSQDLKMNAQVVIWKDGMVQFFHRLRHQNNATLTPAELGLVRNLNAQIGLDLGPNSQLMNSSVAFANVGGATNLFNTTEGIRPGWMVFNPSDAANLSSNQALGILAKSTNNGSQRLRVDLFSTMSQLVLSWDYSRDLFSVADHPKLRMTYNTLAGDQSNFRPTVWGFEEWRWGNVHTISPYLTQVTDLSAASQLNTETGENQKDCRLAMCTSPDFESSPAGYEGEIVATHLNENTIVAAMKINSQQSKPNTTSSGGTLLVSSIDFIHAPDALPSVEIFGNLNPLGLKASFYRESQEDSPIPTVALTKLFEIAPATVNAFNFYVESVQDANGGSVPVDVVFKSGTLGFVTKQRNWNGNFTVVVKVVRKSDNVFSTIPVFVTVLPGKDAPVIFQGDKTNQLPYHIAMYGQEASTPINLASTDLVWDDESPLTSLVWTPTFTGATPQPQIDYPLLNSNNQLKLFFGTDAPPSGIWNLSLKATDPTSLSDSKVLTVHRFASSIEVVPNSQVLTQLSPTGEVLAQFRVLLPKNHDALELKELVMGVWYSDRDMNILDHSPLDIGTCRNRVTIQSVIPS